MWVFVLRKPISPKVAVAKPATQGNGNRRLSAVASLPKACKNVLLKCRRPWATAFEIALPLVLFLLLVYVRVIYETIWYGPFFYRSSVLNPFGLDGELDSKALRDNGAPFEPWKETLPKSLRNDASDDGPLSASQLALGESLCSAELLNTAADRLEEVLSFRGASGVTVAEELLRLDPLAVGKAVTEATDTISNFLTDGSATSRGKVVREDFFNSGLDRTTTEVGERLQREIDMLASLLDAVDGPAQAGRLAEGWYREACATNASARLGTSNVTALSDFLWNLGLTLQETGVARLFRPGMPESQMNPGMTHWAFIGPSSTHFVHFVHLLLWAFTVDLSP
eukprot:s2051_g3.t1